MSVTPELDAEFRARAVREGLVDIRYDVIDSPVGKLLVAATERGLARIHFGHDGQEEELARIFGVRVLRAPIDEVRRELDEYFEGKRTASRRRTERLRRRSGARRRRAQSAP
jgi:methylated-DNA-[protein]-cysteine S-methyltransferase